MPGVVGIFSSEGLSESQDIITVMSNAIRHELHQHISIYHYNNLDLGKVDLGIFGDNAQPRENEEIVAFVWGECLNSQEERSEIIRGVSFEGEMIQDRDFLIASYRRDPVNFVNQLKGSFIAFILDRRRRKLTIANDRFGFRPFYYCHQGSSLIFSSEVKAILKHPLVRKTVDVAGLADFFNFGFVTGTKTFFEDIMLLPPGSILTFEQGKCQVTQYWSLTFPDGQGQRRVLDHVERLASAIKDAVRAQAGGDFRFGLPLSGGLDSRAIAACLPPENPPPLVCTWGTPDSLEVQIARKVAEELGFKHHSHQRTPNHFVENFERAVVLTDGMLPGNLPLGNFLFEQVFMPYVDICFDGMQSLSVMLPLRLQKHKSCQDVVKEQCFSAPGDVLKMVLADQYREPFSEAAVATLKRIEERTKGLDLINQLHYIDIAEVQPRRESLAHAIKRNFVEIRAPLFDYQVVDVARDIPSHLRRNRYIYYKMFSRLSPKVAAIVNMGTGFPLTYPPWCQLLGRIKKGLTARVQQKFYGAMGQKYNPHRLSDWGIDFDAWFDESPVVRRFVTETLADKNLKDCEHLDRKGVRQIVDARLAGKKEYTGIVNRILTYVIWRKAFL